MLSLINTLLLYTFTLLSAILKDNIMISSVTDTLRYLARPGTIRTTRDIKTRASSFVSVVSTVCSNRFRSTDWSQCSRIVN